MVFLFPPLQNPSYYDLEATGHEAVSSYLSSLVESTLAQLEDAGCLEVRRHLQEYCSVFSLV